VPPSGDAQKHNPRHFKQNFDGTFSIDWGVKHYTTALSFEAERHRKEIWKDRLVEITDLQIRKLIGTRV
jgi:hypothetical protein